MENKRSALCPGYDNPGERAPGIPWTGGWVGPQSRSGRGGKRNPYTWREPNLGHSAHSESLYWQGYPG